MSRISVYAMLLLTMLCGRFLVAEGKQAAGCGDLLAELQKKPTHLEFLNCSRRMELQGKPLKAAYRVSGADASEVERFLVREFGIRKMTHTCCEWASTQNSYVNKDGRVFLFEMGSGETLVSRKDQWRKITYFSVEVELETEEP